MAKLDSLDPQSNKPASDADLLRNRAKGVKRILSLGCYNGKKMGPGSLRPESLRRLV